MERDRRDKFEHLKSYYESVIHEKDKFMQALRESHEIGIKEYEKVIAEAESSLNQKDLEVASIRKSYGEEIRNKEASVTALEEMIKMAVMKLAFPFPDLLHLFPIEKTSFG